MLEIAAIVDIGRMRENNDDRILLGISVYDIGFYRINVPGDTFLAAVADGMGGEKYGNLAAEIAAKAIAKHADQLIDEEILNQAVQTANDSIVEEQTRGPEYSHMGTTLSGVFIQGEGLITFHVGDSRVYRFRDGLLRQLTRDQSQVQQLIDFGQITPEQARNHPERNVILQALGERNKIEPEIIRYDGSFFAEDILLLCSDGLTDMLDLSIIEEVLKEEDTLETKCRCLVDLANEYGGHDNISVILILNREG